MSHTYTDLQIHTHTHVTPVVSKYTLLFKGQRIIPSNLNEITSVRMSGTLRQIRLRLCFSVSENKEEVTVSVAEKCVKTRAGGLPLADLWPPLPVQMQQACFFFFPTVSFADLQRLREPGGLNFLQWEHNVHNKTGRCVWTRTAVRTMGDADNLINSMRTVTDQTHSSWSSNATSVNRHT